MKHLHMMMAFITIGLFIWQSYKTLSSQQPLSKKSKIATHVVYTLLIISGIVTVMPLLSLDVPLQWLAAKIILLIAAISASMKAFRASATPTQSKTGILIAGLAYIGILFLAFVKPDNFI